MSHPDDERNPWKSLADLLSNKMDVATLVTAIHEKGIRTWDRFERMIKAKKATPTTAPSNEPRLPPNTHPRVTPTRTSIQNPIQSLLFVTRERSFVVSFYKFCMVLSSVEGQGAARSLVVPDSSKPPIDGEAVCVAE